jgi:hypothetical protein
MIEAAQNGIRLCQDAHPARRTLLPDQEQPVLSAVVDFEFSPRVRCLGDDLALA